MEDAKSAVEILDYVHSHGAENGDVIELSDGRMLEFQDGNLRELSPAEISSLMSVPEDRPEGSVPTARAWS